MKARITMQFEIDGTESDDELAAMKRLEHRMESHLAKIAEELLTKLGGLESNGVRDGLNN